MRRKLSILVRLILQSDLRPNGAHDNEHFDQIMDEAMTQYKTRLLPVNMHAPFVKLLEGVQKIVTAGKALAKKNKPSELIHPVVYVVRKDPVFFFLLKRSLLILRFYRRLQNMWTHQKKQSLVCLIAPQRCLIATPYRSTPARHSCLSPQ
jgi:hypothetical protein